MSHFLERLLLQEHFRLPIPDCLSKGHQSEDVPNDSTLIDEDETLPDCFYTYDSQVPQLTDRGRYQVSCPV